MPGLFDLTGRVVIVTGAGQGIGRAIAVGLAEHHARVACADVNQSSAEGTAAAIGRAGEAAAMAVAVDVRQAESTEAMAATVEQHFGRVDALVNAAGVTRRLPATDFPIDEWRRIVDVNLVGTFLSCQAAGRRMVAAGRGSIVNIASIAALAAMGRGNTPYTASKGGVAALTRELAIEWAPSGVRVNAIAPVHIRTPLIEPILNDPATLNRLIANIPLGRIGEPEELVGPTIFLLSDAASLVTGHVLAADGGYLAR